MSHNEELRQVSFYTGCPLDEPVEPVTSWPYQISETEFKAWRARELAKLPPQSEETIPPLLFVEVEVVRLDGE